MICIDDAQARKVTRLMIRRALLHSFVHGRVSWDIRFILDVGLHVDPFATRDGPA